MVYDYERLDRIHHAKNQRFNLQSLYSGCKGKIYLTVISRKPVIFSFCVCNAVSWCSEW